MSRLFFICGEKQSKIFIGAILGCKGDAYDPEELNEAYELKEDDFDELIKYMMLLKIDYPFKIFGGCCGTNEKHISKDFR